MRRMGLALLLVIVSTSAWAYRPDVLTIGLIPEQNVFKQNERYKPLGEYLSKKVGIPVKFTMLSRYGNIIDSFNSGTMDAAFWGSFTGAMAIRKVGVEPLARPLWENGTSTYYGMLFVRRDSGISEVSQMKGKRMVFVDRATTAGYVFPLAYLHENGVADHETFFGESYFAGSHDAAIMAVVNGDADVGAAKNTIFEMLTKNDPGLAAGLLVLAESDRVPSNGLGIRKDVDEQIKTDLRDTLLGMQSDPEGQKILKTFGAKRFLSTTLEDYRPVFELAQKAGIDLAKYVYKNQ